jgi:NAD(P) transhydrogenase subunit beta
MIVGASGSILTKLMADAMNRSIPRIVAGGFGGGVAGARGRRPRGQTVQSTSAADAAIQLAYASQVVVVPGYGMAVAQAQHAVASWPSSSRHAASRSSTRSTRSPAACPGT